MKIYVVVSVNTPTKKNLPNSRNKFFQIAGYQMTAIKDVFVETGLLSHKTCFQFH